MIKSFSSCLPGSTQTTSWTQNTTCEFLGNFDITVEGPISYDISSTPTNYEIDAQTNLPLYLQVGKTYKFNFNSTDDPVVLFNNLGLPVPYTTELNRFDRTDYDLRNPETNSPYNFNIPLPVAVASTTTINYNVLLDFPPLPAGTLPPYGTITINIQSSNRVPDVAYTNRINNRCSVPGANTRFRIAYTATNKYRLGDYALITYTIFGPPGLITIPYTGLLNVGAATLYLEIPINNIVGPDQTFYVEFRNNAGILFYTTPICTVYANTATHTAVLNLGWTGNEVEVNQLQKLPGVTTNRFRLTDGIDFVINNYQITFLNLYHDLPPPPLGVGGTTYVFQVLPIKYILPYTLNPNVWDVYLFDNNTRLEVRQVLNVDYDIIGNIFHWRRTKVLPVFPSGGSFSVQPMIGQQGSATWTPMTAGTYRYASYINPATHIGIITVTNGPYTVLANTTFSLKSRLKATARFVAPVSYNSYNIYNYRLCDLNATFVVVTKNNFNPLILSQYRLSRWYNYFNNKPTFSFGLLKESTILPTVNHDYLVNYGVGIPDLKNDLIFLNHIEEHINFYGGVLNSLKTVKTPTSMIHFERINYKIGSVEYNEIILLGVNGKIYKLKKDLTFEESIFVFFPAAIPTAPSMLNNDMIGEDAFGIMRWPSTKASPISSILFPNVKHFCVSDDKIFLIASNVLRICDFNFNILRADINFPAPLHSVSWLYYTGGSDYLYITNEYHQIYFVVTLTGTYTVQTPIVPNANTVLGIPKQISPGQVLVPFSHEKKLVLFNTIGGAKIIDLVSYGIHDFIPFYVNSSNNIGYITGHDTNTVLTITTKVVGTNIIVDIKTTDFSDKVTTVDVRNNSLLASHYMKFRHTLDLSNIEKIIPFSVESKEGAATFISTNPKKIKLLGKEQISCITGPYTSWWSNGIHRQLLRTDDYFSISYKGPGNGTFSTYVIIGETAIDFLVKVYDSSSRIIDFFDPAPPNGINVITTSYTYMPPNGVLGTYTLPYPINFFGKQYLDFSSTYNGIIGFDPVYNYNIRSPIDYLTTPNKDALVIEPVEGWPDYPIDNSDVTNIKYGTLAGGLVPGVYIDQGFTGVFAYYKFKYIGTLLSAIPNGNVLVTCDIIQTGISFNFQSTANVVVGQTVSNTLTTAPPSGIAFTNTLAHPVSNTVTVTAVYNHAQTAQAYYATGNKVYLDSNLNPVKQYSNISSVAGTKFHSFVNTVSNLFAFGNTITHIYTSNATVIMTGIHHPDIELEWIYDFEEENQTRFIANSINAPAVITINSSIPLTPVFKAKSISSTSFSFTPAGNISTISNSIMVSKNIFNSVKINEELFSNIFYLNGGSDFVDNKYIIVRRVKARVFPARVIKVVSTTIRLFLESENIPDGTVVPITINNITITTLQFPIRVVYSTIGNAGYTKMDFTGSPSGWTGEASYRPDTVLNFSDTVYDPINKTLKFDVTLYGTVTELRLTTAVLAALDPPENWTFLIKVNYGGNSTDFLFPGGSTSVQITSSRQESYIPPSGQVSVSDDLNEYYLAFNKDIYISNKANVVTSTYTTYEFYTDPAVVTILTAMQPTKTIAVASNLTDVTEVKTRTWIKYRAHIINTANNVKDQISTTNNSLITIDIKGNFIDLSWPQTLAANSQLLFKHVYPHPVHSYEVGFYWGKGFQYIEYNYNEFHDNTKPKGITNSSGFIEQFIAPAIVPGNFYSYVWASTALNGVYQSVNNPPYIFGNGVFVPGGTSGNLRQPRIWQIDVNRDNVLRYDLIVDNNLTVINDVRCSIEYGLIHVNGRQYDGSYPILENDLISFYFFFGDNEKPWTTEKNPYPKEVIGRADRSLAIQNGSTVVYSLGSTQYNLTIVPEKFYDPSLYRTYDFNFPKSTKQAVTITINVNGWYHIPSNFLNASGIGAELIYTLIPLSGIPVNLTPGSYYSLQNSENIIIDNFFTSLRDNDFRELIFTGPEYIRVRLHTPNVYSLVNNFSLLLANQPFTQLTRPTTLVSNGPGYIFLDSTVNVEIISTNTIPATMPPFYPKILDDELPFYKTNFITLTSTSGVPSPVTLFVDTFGTGFNLNGNSVSDNYAIVNTYVDNIAVEWNIKNYNDTRAVVWQIEKDLIDNSNVYIEVGEVLINQRTIQPIVKSQPKTISRTINFNNLNNQLMFFNNNLEFIHDHEIKTTTAVLSKEKQNFTSGVNLLATEKQISFFASKNFLYTQLQNFTNSSNTLKLNNFRNIISSTNTVKFHSSKINFVFTKNLEKVSFTKTKGNVSVNTYRYINLFNKTESKYREFDTTFFYSIGFLSPRSPELFSKATDNKFLEYPNTFQKSTNEIKIPVLTETYLPILGNSNPFNITLTKEKTYEKINLAENYFSKLVDEKFDLSPTIFTKETTSIFQLAAEYFSRANEYKLLMAAKILLGKTKEKFYIFGTTFFKLTSFKFLQNANNFTKINESKFLPYAKSFSKLNQFQFSPAAEIFTSSNKSKHSLQGQSFNEIRKFKFESSSEIFKSRNDSRHIEPPNFFKNATNPFYDKNASIFNEKNKELYINFNKFITSFNQELKQSSTRPYYTEFNTLYNFTNIFYFKDEPLYKDQFLNNIPLSESPFKTTIFSKDVSNQEAKYNYLYKVMFEEFEYHRVLPPLVGGLLEQKVGFKIKLPSEFEHHGVLPPLSGGLLEQKVGFKIKLPAEFEHHGLLPPLTDVTLFQKPSAIVDFPPELERHGLLPPLTEVLLFQKPSAIVDFPPELERHGLLPPLTGTLFLSKPSAIVDFPPELERHGLLPPLYNELLVQRHGLRIPLNLSLEYHGIPIPLPPEIERHGLPVPLPPEIERHGLPVPFIPELIIQNIKDIPLPAEFETHGVLPPLTGEVLIQRHGLQIRLPAEFETHGLLPPFTGEVLVQRHGLRIPLPVDKEYHGIPVPLPPELEYHGILVPLPSHKLDINNTGLKIAMPAFQVQENTQYHILKQNWELFQEIEWNNDNPYAQGAFMTNFKIFVNEGKDSDYKGYPPFIPYQPNTGSELLSKGLTYGFGGFSSPNAAAIVAAKYISAGVIQIVGTSHWNYRILFDKKVFAPTRSMIFPRTWYIRGA